MSETDKYMQRGVSSQKEDVHAAISTLDKGLFPRAFCKILPDFLSGDTNYGLVMHADGAGTKSSLAYAYWRETGDISVWHGIAQDALVMNINDMLCVGLTENIAVSSTIGRNKGLIPGEVIKALIEGSALFIENMNRFGANMQLTGGETADLGDVVRTILVDSTMTGRLPLHQVVDNAHIAPGQVVVGLASYGKTVYEDAYNGGMGSNGLTSARHDVFHQNVALKYPETYDQALPSNVVYQGSKALTDPIDILGYGTVPAGKLVLSPTRCFLPLFTSFFEGYREKIKGMVHCSGGGQSKDLHFLQNTRVVKNALLDVPPLFQLIKNESGASWREMYRTFNMGVLMEVFTDEETAQTLIQEAQALGINAQIIGYTEACEGAEVAIRTDQETIIYRH